MSTYTKTVFSNGSAPALNATNLNHNETGIADAHTELQAHLDDTTDAHAASAITNTAAGNIVATTAQAAINELDTEKVAKAGDTITSTLIIDPATDVTALKIVPQNDTYDKYAVLVRNAADSANVIMLENGGNISVLAPFPQMHFRSSTPVAGHDVRTSIVSDKDAWIGFTRNTYLTSAYTWARDSVTEPSAMLGIDSDGTFNFYTYKAGVDPSGVSGVCKIDTDGTLFLSPAATTTNPVANIHTIQRTGSTNCSLALSQTGSGNATLLLDASNGDFAGGDYAQIRHNNSDLSLDIFNGDSAVTCINMNQAGLVTLTGALTATGNIGFSNAGARTISIADTATDVAGKGLTVLAGSTVAGTSVDNKDGGELILEAGLGTGTGTSTITFKNGTTLTTGKTLQTMSTKMSILGNGNVIFTGASIYTPSTATVTSTGVAIPITSTVCEITTDGDSDEDNGTLANGTAGQVINIYVKAVGNAADSFKITPATMLGGTKISFTANPLGKGCTLVYGSAGWAVVGSNSGTVS